MGLLVACAMGFGAFGFPVTVQDNRGLEVKIPQPPQRVVVLTALYGHILVDLDATELVAGVTDSPNNPVELGDLPRVGPSFSPSVEEILALGPDLVLGGWGDVRSALERAGALVLTVGEPDGSIAGTDDIFAAIRAVGRAVGRPDEAARIVGEIAVDVLEVERQVLGLPKIRVALLYLYAPDSAPYTIGSDSVEHELLLRAGGDNVFADLSGFPQVSLEAVLARDPEVIITDPTQVDHILESAHLQEVTAVREGRVYGIATADTTSTRVARALREIARRLHPDAFEED